jgi:hypothetical protein
MTNKQLVQLMDAFVKAENDTDKDEWYGTNREIARDIMQQFALFLRSKGLRL